MDSKVIGVIEEQIAVRFTGKVNILATSNHQYLGHFLFKDGEVLQVIFHGHRGVKAFYQLVIQEYSTHAFDYVVEPELVEEEERQIHYPYSLLKKRIGDNLKLYRESLRLRPPENIRIVPEPTFFFGAATLSPEEFDVLATVTDWNTPRDIYQNCQLLDHEITLSLVSLRKKGALKIVASRQEIRS
jgi:hypothetical protein